MDDGLEGCACQKDSPDCRSPPPETAQLQRDEDGQHGEEQGREGDEPEARRQTGLQGRPERAEKMPTPHETGCGLHCCPEGDPRSDGSDDGEGWKEADDGGRASEDGAEQGTEDGGTEHYADQLPPPLVRGARREPGERGDPRERAAETPYKARQHEHPRRLREPEREAGHGHEDKARDRRCLYPCP